MSGDPQRHASAAAIRFHYDVGIEFFRLWLDPTLTYSSALWEAAAPGTDDSTGLHAAQQRKLDYALHKAGASGVGSILDIGCGWGSLLERAVRQHGVQHATGLTLSSTQAEHVRTLESGRISVALESYREHRPARPYDALCCIGAFEHFARPELDDSERIAAYREFFDRCRELLVPNGRMYLQTSAYADAARPLPDFFRDAVFPESDLPYLSEICQASERRFELLELRNDRKDYERTLNVWARNLRRNAQAAAALTSADTVDRYLQYLRLAAIAYHTGKNALYRCVFRRIGP